MTRSKLPKVGMARKKQKAEETKTEIYRHAVEMLKKQQFQEVTISSIMVDLPYSKATFYDHFDGRADLVAEMLAEFRSKWSKRWRGWYTLEHDLPDHCVTTLRNLSALCKEDGHLLRTGRAAACHSEAGRLAWVGMRQAIASVVAANVIRQQKLGVIRQSLNAIHFAENVYDMTCSIISEAFLNEEEYCVQEVTDRLCCFWIPTLYLQPYEGEIKGGYEEYEKSLMSIADEGRGKNIRKAGSFKITSE